VIEGRFAGKLGKSNDEDLKSGGNKNKREGEGLKTHRCTYSEVRYTRRHKKRGDAHCS